MSINSYFRPITGKANGFSQTEVKLSSDTSIDLESFHYPTFLVSHLSGISGWSLVHMGYCTCVLNSHNFFLVNIKTSLFKLAQPFSRKYFRPYGILTVKLKPIELSYCFDNSKTMQSSITLHGLPHRRSKYTNTCSPIPHVRHL